MFWIRLEPDADMRRVQRELQGRGLWTRETAGAHTRGLQVLSHSARVDPDELRAVHGVAEVQAPISGHPLVDASAGRPVRVGDLAIGPGEAPVLAAGPCAVESRAQVESSAAQVADAGGLLLRGGAFKPRTSPHSFCGLGLEALAWLREAADAHGLAVVSEVTSELDVEPVAELTDLLQVGMRNMQNFALLRRVGASGRPALLKRGHGATLEEWLGAGEHLLSAGCPGVIYCERGVRGFDPATRNLLDLGAVVLLRQVHGLPVLVDPSHAAGRRDLVVPLARAALAAGADGLLVESHPNPQAARSDGPQALGPAGLDELARALEGLLPREVTV
jgi:3-deoxy-7-phosphoheptulonate synthase